MKHVRMLLVLAITILIVSSLGLAAIKTAKSSGSWNNSNTWQPTGVPLATENVFIGAGSTVTVTANASCASLTVGKSANPNSGNGTLVINSGVVLTVSGNFSLGDGAQVGTVQFQTPGSGELDFTGTAITYAFANASSIFNGPSVIRRAINGAGTWVFSHNNTRIVTSAGQAAINVAVKTYPNSAIPVGDTTKAIKRYLEVTPSGTLTGDLRFNYDMSELNGLTESNLSAFRYNGTAWVDRGAVSDPLNDFIEVTGVTTWAFYWTGSDVSNPLPVQIASFNGRVENLNNSYNVTLDWMTVSETNNYGFYVERRISSETDFSIIPNSFVAGNGTTLEQHTYSFTDENVPAGTYSYRLRQVDLDGLESFTTPIRVVVDKATDVKEGALPMVFRLNQNYPNPFNPSTRISFSVAETSPTTLKVFNLLGEEVATLFNGIATAGRLHTVTFDASTLVSGIYLYRVQSGNNVAVHKMSVVK